MSLSAQNLDDDFAEAITTHDSSRWRLERAGPLEVYASVSSARCPSDTFQARLMWARYPEDAPSLKFREPDSGRLDLPRAWPRVRGFRPASLDACVNWCAEGLALHPEWRNDPKFRWDSRGNVLLRVLRTMIDEFDTCCEGRHT